jgi:hypothetical protein
MAAIPPKPSLVKSTALAKTQSILQTLNTLLPTTVTELSPVTIYSPSADIAGLLYAPTELLPNIFGFYGSWTAPNLNNGSPYTVQVECFGPGGGGGGGNTTAGGGGGGGGEYACEPQLTVSPNVSYTYCVGVSGTGGCANSSGDSAGTSGQATIFDLEGLTIPGGVVANPGQPGDVGNAGVGGAGGTGSTNSVHFNGGAGGTNQSGLGSDNPLGLAETSGFFVGNTLSENIIPCWYVLNDGPDSTFEVNDNTGRGETGKVTTNSIEIRQGTAPAQVPAYYAPADPPTFPNATAVGVATQWKCITKTTSAGKITANAFSFGGSKITLSCWIQCDPTGIWNAASASSYGVIAANTKNYASNAGSGYALFIVNDGSAGTPKWDLYAMVGNGSAARTLASYNITSLTTPGSWIYVVMTYDAGTLKLYVNSVLQTTATSSGYTSVPSGAYDSTLGLDPSTTANWFFGYMSNVWWANDCMTQAAITQAYGTTAATGGAGGGATGGPGGAGGAGGSASGTVGGAAGAIVATPTQYAAIRSQASPGLVGWNAGEGFPGSPDPGAGGGGGGDMPTAPATVTLQIPFTSAATYNGIDATNPGALYQANQQTTNGTLFTGGVSSDAASGSKNTLALLPAGIAKTLGSAAWTIQQLSITFTNAQPTYATDTVLEFSYTSDTSLPGVYTGSDFIEYVGNALVPAGSTTVTYDLSNSDLGAQIVAGTATAICFGPADNPTFDAYNASTGAQFYNQIYGVGATDAFGNSLQPYLTVVLQKTLTTQVGGGGGVGAIAITQVTNQGQPIAFAQPFAGTDAEGNTYGQGFTGIVNAWTPGQFDPSTLEVWHSMPAFSTNFSHGTPAPMYKFNADNTVSLAGAVNVVSGTTSGIPFVTLPTNYAPLTTKKFTVPISAGTPATAGNAQVTVVASTGAIDFSAGPTGAAYSFSLDGCRWPLDY